MVYLQVEGYNHLEAKNSELLLFQNVRPSSLDYVKSERVLDETKFKNFFEHKKKTQLKLKTRKRLSQEALVA